jgi:PAS domain S-box-containing protein
MNEKPRILVVEDNPTDADLIREMLPGTGSVSFQVESVSRLSEALTRLGSGGIDLVLLDLGLPDSRGLEALHELRKAAPGVPVIVLSGTDDDELAAAAVREGAQDYLVKGQVERRHLARAVRYALEREQEEEALRESQANLARVESFSHIMVCHVALDGRWLKTPPPLCKLLGYSATEPLAGSIQDYFHPDDAAQDWHQMQWLTVSDCPTFGEEKRFVDRQGAVLWLDFHCVLVSDARQEPVMFLIYLRDITQAKHLEEKTQQQGRLLDLAPSAIFLRNLDDVICYWNKGAERLYGWKAEEAIGRKTTDLFCKDIASVGPSRQRIVELGEWIGDVKHVTKAGQELTVESRWMLLSEPGSPPMILSIDMDVTEHKKLEAQFMRAQRLDSIGKLASGIAHDLNNILAPMLMAPELLRGELRTESSKKLLDGIEKNALRGAEIVKQLLTFGRGVESPRGPIQLRSLVRDMKEIMQATFPKNITIRVEASPELWLVTGDATQLHQVLMNLCVNARDALPQGGELTVALENTVLDESVVRMMPGSHAGPYVLMTVTDTGIGIAPECLDRIFDPFFTTKGPGQGTGLGLSTVLGIVRSHHGFVLVGSKVGQGTQFKLYLPANMTAQAMAGETLGKLPQGSGELVLVVDDEPNVRITLRRILEHNGYRTLVASDGNEALAVYEANRDRVQAVVTDTMMPFMDGPRLVRALRGINPQLRILTMTGRLSASDFGGAPLETPAFLSKPFMAGALLKALDELLHGKATGGGEAAARVDQGGG